MNGVLICGTRDQRTGDKTAPMVRNRHNIEQIPKLDREIGMGGWGMRDEFSRGQISRTTTVLFLFNFRGDSQSTHGDRSSNLLYRTILV